MGNSDKNEDWSVRKGKFEGKAIVTSFRGSVNTPENRECLPFQVGVAVPSLQPTTEGLPSDAEAKQLWAIEDEPTSQLQNNYNALYVMSITTASMREFVFYVPEANQWDIEKMAKLIETKINDAHELQFMWLPDGDWSTYNNFADEVK